MQLVLVPGDYQEGETTLSFTVDTIVEVCTDWVILDGVQRPTLHSPWIGRQITVRIAALKRCLTLGLG